MKNIENARETDKKRGDHDLTVDPVAADPIEEPQNEPAATGTGFLDRLRKLFNGSQLRSPTARRDLSKDRTRSLMLLIAGTVGAVLLFIGVFSTPPRPSLQEIRGQAGPNLGRPAATPGQPAGPKGSVTPLLNADIRSNDLKADQLSPADIGGTSRRSAGEDERVTPPETRGDRVSSARVAAPQARNPRRAASPRDAADSLAPYRIDDGVGAPTYRYGGPLPSDPGVGTSGTFSYGGAGSVAHAGQAGASNPSKSSIVFVREGRSASASPANIQTAAMPKFDEAYLLPPGTRLIARIDAATTSALKTPVVASIEYNYERDGLIIVPAGSKVIGEVQQASSEGYLSVRFHTLEMPDGREANIQATAMTLDYKPLRGAVSGKNTGKKLLSRTLSGVGTIAAYVVGAGGGGLGRTVTGETLLRDRVASNIALAGEEQLRNAAYSQNIAVTLAANTRFYVVLQKPAAGTPVPAVAGTADARALSELPTVQELRELMDLRREINRMYQDSTVDSGTTIQP